MEKYSDMQSLIRGKTPICVKHPGRLVSTTETAGEQGHMRGSISWLPKSKQSMLA